MNTIMVVEDNKEMGRLMRFLFELEGFEVISTDTYDEVLPLLCRNSPDAILMDVNIQDNETLDLVHQVRQLNSSVARIPIVMTSASDCRGRCLDAGADAFIMKPFLPDEVVRDITSLSQRRVGDRHDTPAVFAPAPVF